MPTPALNEKIEEPEFIVKAAEDDGSTVEAHKKIAKASRERKELATLVREPGRSLLPFSRVQKIIRADKDIPVVAKEATFLISIATEEFIRRLSEAAQQVAEREKRATVQHKDIATIVRKVDEFVFLEEAVQWLPTTRDGSGGGLSKPTKKDEEEHDVMRQATMLDTFMGTKGNKGQITTGGDIVRYNEDGTMAAGDSDGVE